MIISDIIANVHKPVITNAYLASVTFRSRHKYAIGGVVSLFFSNGYRSRKSTQKAKPLATASGTRVFKVLMIIKNKTGARIARSVGKVTDFDFIISSTILKWSVTSESTETAVTFYLQIQQVEREVIRAPTLTSTRRVSAPAII